MAILPPGMQPGNPPPDIDPSTLSGGVNPSLPPTTSPTVVQGTPSPTPDAIAKHTFGKAVGSIFGGLQPTQNSYTVDPNTGKTVTTTTKTPPGQWARGILAAGLLGSGGIGPEHGEHTFAQGLLSGLTGGAAAAGGQRNQQDAQARAQAQEDYANKLKADEAARANKELTQKELLNNVAIADYNQRSIINAHTIMLGPANDSKTGAQSVVDYFSPVYKTFQDANVTPIKEGVTGDELNKLIQEEQNGIDPGKVYAIATGTVQVTHTDGSISWQPVGNIYPSTTKVGPELLTQLKNAGYDEKSPVYQDAQIYTGSPDGKIAGKNITPSHLTTFLNAIQKGDQVQANALKLKADQAQAARDWALAGEATENIKKLRLDTANQQSVQNGQKLAFNISQPDKNGATPGLQKDKSYNLQGLSASQRQDLANYNQALYQGIATDINQTSLDLKDAQASGADTAAFTKKLSDLREAQNGINNQLNALRGTKNPVGTQPSDFNSRLDYLKSNNSKGLVSKNALALYDSAVDEINHGTPLSSVQAEISKVQTLEPQEFTNLINNINAYGAAATPIIYKNTNDIKSAQQAAVNAANTAYKNEHPVLAGAAQSLINSPPPASIF